MNTEERTHGAVGEGETWVNDVHSQLNRTRVRRLVTPRTENELATVVREAVARGDAIAISGGRHAMGAQQFVSDHIQLDVRYLSGVLSFDQSRGLIEVQAGIQWPELISACHELEVGNVNPWSIAQKQTGADTFTLGGSLSANVHGRGLGMGPLISDIEAFTLLNARGECVTCSRDENAELFRLAIGGYGLFGIVTRVKLRLVPRRRLRRVVEMVRCEELMEKFEERIHEGCLYGDFQFSIDENSPDFLDLGVFSCYRPTRDDSPTPAPRELSCDDWLQLLHLAYTNRAEGFRRYSEYYLSTNGQTYWSDTHQLAPYLPDYAARLRELSGTRHVSSLMITELYVPRTRLADFLQDVARTLRANNAVLIYGTVRLIEQDDESFLAWAKQPYACVVFNLLVQHTPEGIAASAASFRSLIDLAIARGGSYYLTYHKFATREQVKSCYPQFEEFLGQKRKYDPAECFQSDWYRFYRERFVFSTSPKTLGTAPA